jgi:UDP-glucose 4-epimerase
MTYVSDAVEATVAALGAPEGVYNVGGGAHATVDEMLDAVRRVTGAPVEARYGPEAEGDVRSTWADSRRAARALGYGPRVGLEQGLAAQVEWAVREKVAVAAL